MENKKYSEMTKDELWREISIIISLTNLTEADKNLFTEIIKEHDSKI